MASLQANIKHIKQVYGSAWGTVHAALHMILRRRTELPKERNDYIFRLGVFEPMLTIYQEELRMLETINSIASRPHKDLNDKILTRCQELIAKIDVPAQDVKYAFAGYLTRPDVNPKRNWWKDEKAALRKLVLEHWRVVDYITSEHDELSEVLWTFVKNMRRELNNLGWLFVVFICFAEADQVHLNNLLRFCRGGLKAEHLVLWWDANQFEALDVVEKMVNKNWWWHNNIPSNQIWHEQLLAHIDEMDFGITLVSKHFPKLEYIQSGTMLSALKKRQEEGMEIFTIILDDYDWKKKHRWLRPSQALPDGRKTISNDYVTDNALREFYCKRFMTRLRTLVGKLSYVDEEALG